MKTWSLGLGDPLNLVIAADARLCTPTYTDDQIWSLLPSSGDPPALSLHSTLGLRACQVRLFPRFSHRETRLTEPASFFSPPVFTHLFPNRISLTCQPFQDLDTSMDYWVPSSQVVAGRVTFANPSVLNQTFHFEWFCMLNPLEEGESMAPTHDVQSWFLRGATANLTPTLVMNGNPQPTSGSYSGLSFDVELEPGASRQFFWALVCLQNEETSLQLARRTITRPWEAEMARIELTDAASRLEVETGNPDWDAVLHFAASTARSFIMPGPHLPEPSFVLARQPDLGFSARGDGNDYSTLWGGQTVLDACHLASMLLPTGRDVIEGIVRNFLSVQQEDGWIDWKPGAGGQRSHRLAQPMLAHLAAQVDDLKSDHAWLVEIFPALLKFTKRWFAADHDSDRDGLPEWDHPVQNGLEEFLRFYKAPSAGGASVPHVETPALAAMLFNECKSLIRLAHRLETHTGKRLTRDITWLNNRATAMQKALDGMWDAKSGWHHLRDAASNSSPAGAAICDISRNGETRLKKAFRKPARLVVNLTIPILPRQMKVEIEGEGQRGKQKEELTFSDFTWIGDSASASTGKLYKSVNRLVVSGLPEGTSGSLASVDFQTIDISMLLPLWAKMVTPARARLMVERALPALTTPHGLTASPGAQVILMQWNWLVAEGLLNYGYRPQAAAIFTGLISLCVPALRQHQTFFGAYQIQPGGGVLPAGDRGSLYGLPPLGLLLKLAGIRSFASDGMTFEGYSPFPAPINVKYQSTSMICHSDRIEVLVDRDNIVEVTGDGIHRLSVSTAPEIPTEGPAGTPPGKPKGEKTE